MTASTLATALWHQLFFEPPKPTLKYTGQTVVVTGSNVGLGLETARWFVRLDAAKVILAVRSLDKGEAAKKSIEESEHRQGVVEVWHLDLSSYDSVKENAARLTELERIDVLIENAGIVTKKFTKTEDNESSITTNVVSPLLHALLLLPKLRETAAQRETRPKLVFTTSFVHAMTQFAERKEENLFEALADQKKADMSTRYYLSKLLEMYAIFELAGLTASSSKEDSVIINNVNPGWVVTEVMREQTGLSMLMFRFARFFLARSTEVGSRTIMNAAEGGEETHGKYLDQCHIATAAPIISSEEGQVVQKRVWDELSQKLEKIRPGLLQNI